MVVRTAVRSRLSFIMKYPPSHQPLYKCKAGDDSELQHRHLTYTFCESHYQFFHLAPLFDAELLWETSAILLSPASLFIPHSPLSYYIQFPP